MSQTEADIETNTAAEELLLSEAELEETAAAEAVPEEPEEKELPSFEARGTFLTRLYEMLRERVRGDWLDKQGFDEVIRKARSHTGGKAKAHRRQSQVQAAETGRTGFMVGLWLEPAAAQALVLPEGEPAEALHITLCYCGDMAQVGEVLMARATAAVEQVAQRHAPLQGQIGGVGRFLASPTSEGREVIYAAPDVPWLAELRDAVANTLRMAGCAPSLNHGWTPHITLAYAEPGTPLPTLAPVPLRFACLTVARGDVLIDLPLTSRSSLDIPHHYSEGAVDLADLAAQGGEVRLYLDAADALAFAEPPDWIPYLPKPGTYKHPRYGEIGITVERNRRFVGNFNAHVYQERVPLDAEHETKLSGACGWITALRMNRDGSADARVEWTDRGRSLVEANRFRYISPEWYDEWQDPATGKTHKDVAIGGAITTRPFFKEGALRPLVASERGLEELSAAPDTETPQEEPTKHMAESKPNPLAQWLAKKRKEKDVSPEEMSEAMGIDAERLGQIEAGESEPSEAMLKKAADKLGMSLEDLKGMVPGEDRKEDKKRMAEINTGTEGALVLSEEQARAYAEMQAEMPALRQANESLRQANEALAGRVEKMERDARNKRFGEITAEWAEPAKHVALMEQLADALGEESAAFAEYVRLQRAAAEQMRQAGLFEEKGSDASADVNGGAWEKIDARARTLMAEEKITRAQAIARVASENSGLYNEYLAEQRGGR
jgi:transcriptional regulator with XRE-family HTH domain/2'-5' RNA ligase